MTMCESLVWVLLFADVLLPICLKVKTLVDSSLTNLAINYLVANQCVLELRAPKIRFDYWFTLFNLTDNNSLIPMERLDSKYGFKILSYLPSIALQTINLVCKRVEELVNARVG